MGRMMGLYMPLFIGYLSYLYQAGLALYFVTSNVVGILQYAATGRLDLQNLLPGKKTNEEKDRIVKQKPLKEKSQPQPKQKVKKAKS